MQENSLTIVDRDGGVTIARLALGCVLDVRVGDLIPDDAEDGHWRVEEVDVEQRHLVVAIVGSGPAVELIERLAA